MEDCKIVDCETVLLKLYVIFNILYSLLQMI